jgi:DNA-binding CsgD family transcriptional regulator
MENTSISHDILDICRPFFESSGINAFSYSRLFKDGTRSELWSDAAAFDHTFHKARYIVGAYTPQYFNKNERYSFLEEKVETYPPDLRERYRNQLLDQREYFNHCHCFSILNKAEQLCEYFIFYAPRSSAIAVNYYINNIEKLESFSEYFIEKAKPLIFEADNHRFHCAEPVENAYKVNSKSILEIMTPREKDIAKLLITGATIKDIGVALRISPRTVESHVEKLKMKFEHTRKSILVQQLYMHRHLFD